MSAPFVVRVEGLRRRFGSGHAEVDALREVDFELGTGEFVAIMGPSGSGKSTLLHCIGGISPATEGVVEVDGQRLDALDDDALTLLRRRRIGFVFQSFNLLPTLTAVENVALPMTFDRDGSSRAIERAQSLLDEVGLSKRQDHLPGQLSGGERQRVAIARALMYDPVLLLADEPTGNLDRRTGDQVMELLRAGVEQRNHSLLMVTHDAMFAARADRTVHLADGRIEDEQKATQPRSANDVLEDLEGNQR